MKKLLNENKFYVYAYLNPLKKEDFNFSGYKFDFEPIYIGKGNGRRIFNDQYSSRYTSCFLIKKTNKIKRLGYNIIKIKIEKNLSEKEAFDLEKKLIKTIGRRDKGIGPLTNLSDGGEGNFGYKFTIEQRRNLSIAQTKRYKNNPVSKKTKEKLSKMNKGRKFTEHHKMNISKSKKGICIGEKNNFYGKIHSKKTIKKLSNSQSFLWMLIYGGCKVFYIDHLKNFCKEMDLNYSSLKNAHRNNWTYKGVWKIIKLGRKTI